MGRLLAHPFQFGPWWLWVMVAAAVLVCVVEFWFMWWDFNTSAKKSARAFTVALGKTERITEDYWWNFPGIRELEAAQAIGLQIGRTLAESPQLVEALFDEDRTLMVVAS